MNSKSKIQSPSNSVSRYGRSITPKKIHDPSDESFGAGEKSILKSPRSNPKLSGKIKESPIKTKPNISDNRADSENVTPRQENASEKPPGYFSLPKTPYSLRQRLKTKIQYEVDKGEEESFDVSEESEWEESDSESESSESSAEQNENVLASHLESPTAIEVDSRPFRKSNYAYDPSEYLEKSSARSLTSTKKFCKLDGSQLLSQELSSFVPSHSSHMSLLFKHNQSLFYKWLYTLSEGYNILVYGLGSKKLLLDQFRSKFLNSCKVLVINGYFPGITLKEIISSLLELMEAKSKETADAVFSLLENRKTPPIFLVVHNIDGLALRKDKIQSFFSQLAYREKIHIVASIDHINAPLLWDQKKLSKFNFIWEDCTTYHPYSKEKSVESSLMVKTSASLALSSLRNVFCSLNKNSRSIFKLLLEYTLNPENKNNGMQFSELYRRCRQLFIVSTDLALRTQLTEFIDHQLVKWKKETDTLSVCVDRDVLKTFKDEISSERT